ncbi:hypothetical protein GCM10010872_13580 [Dyella flava]|nr:hypothetical protein GCM10010872_13580 [Dyella flava]
MAVGTSAIAALAMPRHSIAAIRRRAIGFVLFTVTGFSPVRDLIDPPPTLDAGFRFTK